MLQCYNKAMRPTVFSREALTRELRRRTIATGPQLADALGNPSRSTLFRLLREVAYVSSYSHRGRYFALTACARFDDDGLWSHDGVHFSSHGTLLATVEAWVQAAPRGWRPDALDARLGVRTIDPLRKLVRQGRLARVQAQGRALYCSADPDRSQRQQAARRASHAGPPPRLPQRSVADALAAAFALFVSLLNEKQRRLFAGLWSMAYGRGGDRRAAAWVGLTRKTVRKGRRELAAGEVDPQRVRKPGGGRKPLEKKSLH